MYCRPKVLPAICCPTKCCVNNSFENIIQPVVHPSHTTNIHHTNLQYQHHLPHTESFVNEVSTTDIGPVPGPPPAPTVGGLGPAGFGPGGFGPGGFGPAGYPGVPYGVRPRPGFY